MSPRRLLLVGRADSAHVARWAALCADLGYEVGCFEPVGGRLVLRGMGEDVDEAVTAERQAILADTAAAIAHFRPDIVHACGLDPFALVVADALALASGRRPALVVQARGGHELMLAALDPPLAAAFAHVLALADGLITDHDHNFELCIRMGLSAAATARRGPPLPGGGGLGREEVQALGAARPGPPLVLWPKAYLTVGVDGLSVAEGLRRAFERGGDFDLGLLFCFQDEFRLMLQRLWPPALLTRVRIEAVVPWEAAIRRMAEARVMLAPSLLDGIPNVLIEAMACGAIPIVSDHGVLPSDWYAEPRLRFVGNLDPDAIATALLDALALDSAQARREKQINRERAFAHADRTLVAERLTRFYKSLWE